MDVKSVSIRFDITLLEKLRVLSEYEGRSINSQVLILARRAVEEFEKEHGEIEIKE